MGQHDILHWLITQRLKGNNQFFTIKEIKKGLKDTDNEEGITRVGYCLFKLCNYNICEFKGEGLWKHNKLFRVKEEYVR